MGRALVLAAFVARVAGQNHLYLSGDCKEYPPVVPQYDCYNITTFGKNDVLGDGLVSDNWSADQLCDANCNAGNQTNCMKKMPWAGSCACHPCVEKTPQDGGKGYSTFECNEFFLSDATRGQVLPGCDCGGVGTYAPPQPKKNAYIAYDVELTFLESVKFCEERGMFLAEPRTPFQQEKIMEAVKEAGLTTTKKSESGHIWVGGSDRDYNGANNEGRWAWHSSCTNEEFWKGNAAFRCKKQDGSPCTGPPGHPMPDNMTFTNWANGEPNNFFNKDNEDCLMIYIRAMYGKQVGQWNDIRCSVLHHPVCSTNITRTSNVAAAKKKKAEDEALKEKTTTDPPTETTKSGSWPAEGKANYFPRNVKGGPYKCYNVTTLKGYSDNEASMNYCTKTCNANPTLCAPGGPLTNKCKCHMCTAIAEPAGGYNTFKCIDFFLASVAVGTCPGPTCGGSVDFFKENCCCDGVGSACTPANVMGTRAKWKDMGSAATTAKLVQPVVPHKGATSIKPLLPADQR